MEGSMRLITISGGTQANPILITAAEGEEVVLTTSGEVLQIEHPWIVISGIIFDGQFGSKDIIDVRAGSDNLHLKNIEVRNSSKDCIDIKESSNITIEDALIHHCLNWENGERKDAHGIVAGYTPGLTIRNTEIHTFSGDGIQIDPDRIEPGWDNV